MCALSIPAGKSALLTAQGPERRGVGACKYCTSEHLKDEQVFSSELGSCRLWLWGGGSASAPAQRNMHADGQRVWRGTVLIARFEEWLWG